MIDSVQDTTPVKTPSTGLAFLSLFTSAGTLICCALPALLITLGAGAVMAGLIEAVPQITWFGKHKLWVFSFAAVMIILSGYLQWRGRHMPCPADPAQANACMRARRISAAVWTLSLIAFLIGAFFAFAAQYVFF